MRLIEWCSSYQCQVASLQLTVNSDIRRSGEPSRLSLRKQWIFRRALPNDIRRKDRIESTNLLYWVYETKYLKETWMFISGILYRERTEKIEHSISETLG